MWGLVLEMRHGHEQPRLVWTNYPDVLHLVIVALQTAGWGPEQAKQSQKLSESLNPSPEHANVIAF